MKKSFLKGIVATTLASLFFISTYSTAQERAQITTVDGWYKYGVPFPNMDGPVPRLASGKPDMSGQWDTTRRSDITDTRIPGYIETMPYTAWGQRQWDNYDPVNQGDYAGSCLPFGWSRTVHGPRLVRFVHTEDLLVVLAEQDTWFHPVYLDERPHDPNMFPTWWGDSIGYWDEDTLVVETTNMNGYIKLDTIGHPISSQAKFTQTFKRTNFGTMEHTFTVEDPKTYTKPFTIYNTWPLEPLQIKMLEYSCMEGNLENLATGSIKPWIPPEGEDAP